MKFKELPNGLCVSLSGNVAKTSFRAAIPPQVVDAATKKVLSGASLFLDFKRAAVADNVEVPQGQPVLTDERYVYASFRALSQVFLDKRGLDFSVPGVLQAAVPMLFGKTVYPNHDFRDVNNWVGVVSGSKWDAAGEKSEGIPGINVDVKLDAYLNYRLACGVMMTPPAVNAMSLTVVFEFEYSHPEMAMESKWKFFDNLGEEIDGQIVRLIVTKIVDIWEASLVYCGEDRLAKNHGQDPDDAAEESFSANADPAADITPPNSNEEKTMKLNAEQKAKLGIEFDGEDVPETEIHKAAEALAVKLAAVDSTNITELTARAVAGDALVTEKRAEVTRLAKLAELGAAEGELHEVVSGQIEAADADGLIKLEKYYRNRIGDKFPAGGRSSMENGDDVDNAGGVGKTTEKGPARKASLL